MISDRIHRGFSAYIDLVQRHLFLALAAVLLTSIASFYLSSRLSIKGDLKELLPDNYQSVKDLNATLERIGGVGSLIVVAESPNVNANKKFMDDLASRIEKLPEGTIRYLDYKSDDIKKFYEKYTLYYINIEDIDKLYGSIQRRIDYEKLTKSGLFIDFADEDPLTAQIDEIKGRNQKNYTAPIQAFENYYGGEWGRMLIMIIRPYEQSLSVENARRLINNVEQEVAGLDPYSYDPSMKIGFCGNVKSTVEEYDTLKKDVVSTALLCIFLVALAISIFFLRIRIVFLLGTTLIIALSWTFAFTYLSIGYLNSQTAFLGSIILGTGINYGIILMARYVEERRKGRIPADAMKISVRNTLSSTFLAASTTAVAFAVLLLARIKGLNQFGMIGAVGVMLCWLGTFILLPIFTLITERVRETVKEGAESPRKSAVFAKLTSCVVHSPGKVLAVSITIAVLSVLLVAQFVPDAIEYDFTKLRNKTSVASGTEALEKRVSKLFKDSMTPAVVLLDKKEDAPLVCDVINEKNMALPESERRVGSCYSIYSLLPKDQEKKIPKFEKFRILFAKNEEYINGLKGDLKDKVDPIRESLKGDLLTIDDIPYALTKHFEDLKKNKGVVVFVNPRPGMLLSDGRNLTRFSDTIKRFTLKDGRIFHAAGASMIFSDLVKAIRDEAPILTLASFIMVIIFVGFVVRHWRSSWVIIICLVVGIITMLGLAALLKIKLNFFNFIALPLTFGIGVDYAINVVMRLVRDKMENVEHSLRHTGLAVMLCSLTTIIGYSVLIVANNQALASFGWVAIIGELTCISAAVILAPALMVLFNKRRSDA
ncbi:MAG: hypothetical protein COV46_03705 [Deltaproteobacteria bacterium CG11_big_fil_rev_8_21_14_0_20_49_13]|nr:MAG: hypothetical protein COV46_03705 [Deltaproteobacteria bacterium CG11_big_fil_rev_8_21_14_0_20_49_13]